MNERSERQYNLDLLKAVGIIAMVFCHPVLRLAIYRSGYKEDFPYFFGVVILGYYLVVAHGFMFAMGTGMIYSRRKAPSDLIKRGIKLFFAGYVLNFFRYGIYLLGYGLIIGEFLDTTLVGLFEPDILQFAGLAFIVTGMFRKLGLNEYHILAAGLILSVIGYVLPAGSTGSLAMDFLLGHVIYTTETASCFVFCYWYLFVAAGLVFGVILRGMEHKRLLYRRLLVIAGCIAAVYITLTAVFGTLFLSPNRNYYTAGTLEAIGLLSIDLFLLSAFYFLLEKVDVSRFAFLLEISRNITCIYFIHWIILGFVESILCYLLEIVFPYSVIYLIGAVLLILSFLLARCLNRKSLAGRIFSIR